jgi:TIR domain
MTIPRAFISYSHDSQDHKRWVLELATRLRNVGVDAILDQWELGPGDDIPHFMEQNLAVADRVLMICTENYVKKANTGDGGVGYEKMIVTAAMMRRIDSNKAIPIIRQNGSHLLPVFLSSKMYLDFTREDQYEAAFDELTRTLHSAPLFVKPPITTQPFAPVKAVKRTGDGVLELMKSAIAVFESTKSGHFSYRNLGSVWPGSRTMMDVLLEQAEAEGILVSHPTGYIEITKKGKIYALENKLAAD